MDLQDKVAVVTGGTSGIGLATARAFHAEGARVVLTGTRAEAAAAAAAAIGPEVLGIGADVRAQADLLVLRDAVAARHGRLDVLFANAGVAFATPVATTAGEAYDALMDVNVKGVFFTIQALLPLMGPGASIILNTSWLAEVGTAGLSLLSASKAAVRSFARTLSRELLDRGIRVNAVSPGAIDTPIHRKSGATPEDLAATAARIAGAIPLGRFGRAEDIAAAAVFLAGSRSAYMLGAEIAVDGGFAQL